MEKEETERINAVCHLEAKRKQKKRAVHNDCLRLPRVIQLVVFLYI